MNSIATFGYAKVNSIAISGYANPVLVSGSKPIFKKHRSIFHLWARFIINRFELLRFGQELTVFCNKKLEFNHVINAFSTEKTKVKTLFLLSKKEQKHYEMRVAVHKTNKKTCQITFKVYSYREFPINSKQIRRPNKDDILLMMDD